MKGIGDRQMDRDVLLERLTKLEQENQRLSEYKGFEDTYIGHVFELMRGLDRAYDIVRANLEAAAIKKIIVQYRDGTEREISMEKSTTPG